jgi:zinc D-Ala-D-Ala carboxypeptidase
MMLTDHFSLEEFIVTQQRGIDNIVGLGTSVGSRLLETAKKLEEIRELLGNPIIITSGYRSPALNKAVGGAPNSAHMYGAAVDFICPRFGTPYKICKLLEDCIEEGFPIDQLIYEYTWVHVGFPIDEDKEPRRMLLTKPPGSTGYLDGITDDFSKQK